MSRRSTRFVAQGCTLLVLSSTLACSSSSTPQAIWYDSIPGHAISSPKSATFATIGTQSVTIRSQPPLGPADRVFVKNGHFYTVGTDLKVDSEDDKRIRFFGVSLALSANFPSEADGEALASRLAALGVNIVRLHAIDQPAHQADIYPAGILADASRPDLDPGAAQTLKRFIVQLGRHGIYVDLNLHVNHTFPALKSGDAIPPQSKPLQIFDADMVRWQEDYTRNLIAALDLRNTPNLALVEIDNESTLIDNWQEGRLPALVTGRYRSELTQQWTLYEQAHDLESRPLPIARTGLAPDDARHAAEFFVSLDQRYIARIATAVRAAAGDEVAVSGTQIIHSGRWKHGGFANFDVDAAANYIDAHFYIDHYWFPARQWDWSNWRISNSWLGDAFENTLLNVAFARAQDKPFVVSEFNQPWPNQQGSDLLPVVTQFALSQDWDGLILYSYSHDQLWDTATPSDFSLKGDWTKLMQFAQCAHYFRDGFPGTALPRAIISLPRDERITAALNNVSGNLASYLSTHFNVPASISTERQIQLGDAARFSVQLKAGSQSSSYLSYDRSARQIVFGSSYAAGISGYLAVNRPVRSSILELTLGPRSRGFATAFVTSIDGTPLAQSTRMLLSLPGSTMGSAAKGPQQLESTGLRDAWWTITPDTGSAPSSNLYAVAGPVQMERIPARITLYVRRANVSVYALDANGRRISKIEARTDGELVTFAVNGTGQPFAVSYEIVTQR
jgi:hypothetical protein